MHFVGLISILGECLTILLVVQAAAVVVIVIIKRVHDDSVHKEEPPAKWIYTMMHYLKYPFLLYHIDYKSGAEKYHGCVSAPVSPVITHVNGKYHTYDVTKSGAAKRLVIKIYLFFISFQLFFRF